MQKDTDKLARVAEEEIALLKPVHHLLEKLAKGNASTRYQQCMARPGGKMQVQIETTGSFLPKHYTISVPGTKIFLMVIFLMIIFFFFNHIVEPFESF